MTPSIPTSGVRECDVDRLLLKEFTDSLDFLQWFSNRVTNTSSKIEKLLDAQWSVKRQEGGESDLEILMQDSIGNQIFLLIENKVSAAFQHRQAERYQECGQNYKQNGRCTNFYTILVAPEQYFGSATALKGFDARVTYEEIRGWFQRQDLDESQHSKIALLTAAIKKREGEGDPFITKFWHQYWELSQDYAPTLNMNEPADIKTCSRFIPFLPTSLPKDVSLLHKTQDGKVDLQFRGKGKQIDELKKRFEDFVESDMRFEKACGSGAIRLCVPLLDMNREFDAQREDSLLGIKAAKRLLDLYETYRKATADRERTQGLSLTGAPL